MGSRYEEEWQSSYKMYIAAFQELQLETLCFTENVKCFLMRKPGTRINSVQITFTPEGIAIQGDHCPGDNGVCSAFGYGMEWFTRRLDRSYICEKFLRQRTITEKVQDDLDDMIRECDDGHVHGTHHVLSDLISRVSDDGLTSENMAAIEDSCLFSDGIGMAYPIYDSAKLVAIQERFRELRHS